MASKRMGHGRMHSRVIALTDIDAPFIDRWRALARRPDITPNPFADVDFLRPAAAYLPEAKEMLLLVGQDHGDLLWLMPLIRTSRMGPALVLPGLRNIFDHNWFGQPLIVAGQEAAAASSLLRHLSDDHRALWLRLNDLDADDRFTQSLIEQAGNAVVEVAARGLVVRRPEPTYLSGHSNLKRLRRQRRSFEKSFGKELDLIDSSADPQAVDDFLAMEAAGWKGRNGGASAMKPGHAEFMRQMSSNFRESGCLQLWTLRAGDQNLAMKLNLIANDTLFCHSIAYDEGYATLSAGLQLEIENFQLFHDQPRFRVMDSCADPHNAFVNRLYPDRRSLANVSIGSGPLGRAIVSLAPAGRRLMGSSYAGAAHSGISGALKRLKGGTRKAQVSRANPATRQGPSGLEGTPVPGNES
jgi:CelD/BcsL family acetyltransferase involved in cellulose biosynthesis